MGILREYMEEQAKEKNISVSAWIEERIGQIPSCRIATHVGKFTHPDAKVSLYDGTETTCPGYVATSNSDHGLDIVVNAAYMSTAKFLLGQPLEDGHTVFWHMTNHSNLVEKEFQDAGISHEVYVHFKDKVLQCAEAEFPDATDGRLKQVYFPVGPGEYHLLTIMPSSSLLLSLKETIQEMDKVRRQCQNKKDEAHGNDYGDIWNLTEISFGGTKPQNISYLNNANGGAAYLLPSLPPILSGKGSPFPARNFFKECLPTSSCRYAFGKLHELFQMEKNNIAVRNEIKQQVQDVIEFILTKTYEIRSAESGWSDDEKFSSLPRWQKIWLDSQYVRERQEDEWRDDLSAGFARWLIKTYGRLFRQDGDIFSDEELKFFKYEFRSVVDEVVRYE